MRPLTSEDPRTVGPYRTLVRLGAGGMGVVYLARSAGGALAAVKVIRAEHAADPGFRARFRREAETAARITGPWVVPVLGADTEAREPWLATAFVPGPSLAQVVAAGGPLPTVAVRELGSRLAEALVAVHEAGLIHRDVKPGNVLLALDGPRLIDFGIARHEGATALTATGAVIGTPGYLAPEQASAGPLGPPCDVFSLGCVLVYAATGRGPFGEGGGAGALFRTVHEEPDLTGIPPGLAPLIAACLAKDPAARPTASRVRDALAGGGEAAPDPAGRAALDPAGRAALDPAGRAALDPAGRVMPDPDRPDPDRPEPSAPSASRDPRESLRAASDPGESPDRGESPRTAFVLTPWQAPAGLPALIAERSAAALALPDPEPLPTTPTPAGDETAGGETAGHEATGKDSGPARRRVLTAGAAGAVLLAGGSAAVWNALRGRGTGAGGPPSGSGESPTYTIGLHADLGGPGRATGLAHQRGALLAVADHNSLKDKAFRLALRTEDDRGDPAAALRVAERLAADPAVIAVLGPTGGVLREELVQRYGAARLANVVVAAGSSTVESGTGLHLCVTRPLDDMLTPGLISHLARTTPAGRILLVEDAADPGLAGEVGRAFREAAPTGATLLEHPLVRGDAGFGTVARKAVTGRADAVVLGGGDASRAARLATALTGEGFTGARVAAGPALGPAFLDGAGDAADGWVFAEAYADPAALPAARGFTAAHRERFGAPPATWAAEAYDAVGLIARAAGTTSASGEVRSGIGGRIVRTEHRGIVRTLAFTASTRRTRMPDGIFLYRIEQGRPRFLGPYEEVREASGGSGR
ncbi:bifunctional serine/threonine-protein kinase/ABC transporter substrate-binding protein [Streptomyces sp. PgraA7]|uniref:bifunctional serine/threonine-protein kinase/ABC transporter substrate-binding protein n=1 Tax=unclassified Streptomyces TaxID=2593676 RepID=UPI000B4FF16B|nr:bifunctional serine/threonine-protein kinase/ABC transporter substrate-binding protein [Streptomyces sp. PgraA7]MYX00191.1 ABC transporter substrate-binding protein [Streptomyces sp. SID8378]SNB87189.1 Serine/threonine protein kinase [Streptomyces sp. PgraA7]